jgi:hypothetical protein
VVFAALLCLNVFTADAADKYYMPIPAENPNVQFYNSDDGKNMYMINEGDQPVMVAYCLVTMMGKCNPLDTNPTACGKGNPEAENITPDQFFEALSHWGGAILWPGQKYVLWYRICPGRAQHSLSTLYFKYMEGEQLEGFYSNIRQYKSSWSFQRQYN